MSIDYTRSGVSTLKAAMQSIEDSANRTPPDARRILVVEDEMLIALNIEDMVTDLGFEVVGPAMRLAPALAMARSESFDCAILDVNLASEKSFPVADALRERGIPFIFATGYGTNGLDDAYRGVGTLQKPFRFQDLERALNQALGDG